MIPPVALFSVSQVSCGVVDQYDARAPYSASSASPPLSYFKYIVRIKETYSYPGGNAYSLILSVMFTILAIVLKRPHEQL